MFSFVQVLKPEIKEDVLRAAKELFFERGYEGATMRMVAERIPMSASNLYKYFVDKGALFEAVVGVYASGFRKQFVRELSHRDKDEFDRRRINSMVAGFSKAINADPKLFYILMERSGGSAHGNFKSGCAALLAGHILDGLGRNPRTEFLVDIVVSNLFTAFAAVALEYGGTERVEEQLGLLFRYHMAGYTAMLSCFFLSP